MKEETHPYPRLARLTLEQYLSGQEIDETLPRRVSDDEDCWSPLSACFVSIKTRDGDLRGCIGTIFPSQPNLGLEIMANAVSAATGDPRFPPMSRPELAGARISVDVLDPPEPVTGRHQLDPRKWGVIVEKDGRRGLLLPDLEGVDTVDKQLAIAAGKAGLRSLDGVRIQRFRVRRFPEEV